MMKTCTTCKKEKSVDEFHKKKSCADGYNYQCKRCAANYAVAHREKLLTPKQLAAREERFARAKAAQEAGDLKVCTTCRRAQTCDRFAQRATSADGLDFKCKDCKAAYHREYNARTTGIIQGVRGSYKTREPRGTRVVPTDRDRPTMLNAGKRIVEAALLAHVMNQIGVR